MDNRAPPTASAAAQGELPFTDPEVERSLLAQLLESSRLYRTGQDYLELLDFTSRLRNFAPFNAMLLQVQKPGLTYAASAWDWQTRFNRTIKEGARPLLILWPFGPVALVYDVLDTEGEALPADVAETFHATGPVTRTTIVNCCIELAKSGIHAKLVPAGDAKAGKVWCVHRSPNRKTRPDYQVRVNSEHPANVQFVTLVHELGHLFLGHMGSDGFLQVAPRPPMDHHQYELEAESLAYLVCKRHGVESKSQSYLADHVTPSTTLDHLDIYVLLKAAGQVESVLGIAAHTLFEPRADRKPG
jgi:hypothetical protein